MKKIYFLLLLVMGISRVWAQTTVTVGGGASVTCPATPTATWTTPPTGITFSNWSRGSGVTCGSASNGLSGSVFNAASAAAGFTANRYYSVTITADATHTFTLNNLVWATAVSTGSANFTVQYSNDGGAVTTFGTTGTNGTSNTFSGSVSVAAGKSLVLYLIPWGTGATGTTVRWVNGSTINLTAATVGSTPTALAITSVSPASPTANAPFSVTVQAQDGTGSPSNVTGNTTVNLSLVTGTGTLGGTLTGVITSGSNAVTITGNTYSVGENGVVIRAADAAAALTSGTATFNVLAAASQLAFVGVPSSGGTNTALTSFTVEARRPDNSVDNTYTGNITITKASGPGTLSGTTTVAAVAGVATFSTLQFNQAGTYTITAAASGLTSATSGNIVITTPSAATDYFRSAVTNGNWTSLSTWQSSPDNATWQTSTLIPDANASMIYILAGNTVVVSTNVTASQIEIQNGGVLSNSANIFTIADGALTNDLVIDNGGIFVAASSAASPAFGASGARLDVNTGGIFRVSKTGYTGNGSGMNADNFVYQNGAIVEYTITSAYSASGVTFFPNVDAVTVPVFRTTAATSVGGANNTVFNGLFEANGAATFTGTGTKTFRNGIIGTADVDGSASGKFIINGGTATIGGTGALILPTNGLDLGNATSANVSVTSNKSVTGNIALTNAIVELANNNLTVAGAISGAAANSSYISTSGTGALTIKNVTGATLFPVGNGDYTPATITNTGTADDFTVRVDAGTPCNTDPLQSVNRVWTITEATAGGSNASITLQWNAADENVSFVRGFCAAVHCAGGVVDIRGTKSPAGGTNPYTQTITGISSFSPFGVTSDVAVLPISIEYLQGSKQGSSQNLAWKVNCTSQPSVAIVLERSGNGRDFNPIYSITATALQCQQAFGYTDASPLAGVNYYRLKITDASGKYSYSSIVALLNATKGLEVVNIAPNPTVNGQFKLNVTSAQATKMDVVITDMQGRVVSRQAVNITAGFNAVGMNIATLAPGIYQLQGNTADGKTRTLNVIKQ